MSLLSSSSITLHRRFITGVNDTFSHPNIATTNITSTSSNLHYINPYTICHAVSHNGIVTHDLKRNIRNKVLFSSPSSANDIGAATAVKALTVSSSRKKLGAALRSGNGFCKVAVYDLSTLDGDNGDSQSKKNDDDEKTVTYFYCHEDNDDIDAVDNEEEKNAYESDSHKNNSGGVNNNKNSDNKSSLQESVGTTIVSLSFNRNDRLLAAIVTGGSFNKPTSPPATNNNTNNEEGRRSEKTTTAAAAATSIPKTSLIIWNVVTGNIISSLPLTECDDGVARVAFSPSQSSILCCCDSRSVLIYKLLEITPTSQEGEQKMEIRRINASKSSSLRGDDDNDDDDNDDTLSLVGNEEGEIITCQCWTACHENVVLFGTSTGRVVLYHEWGKNVCDTKIIPDEKHGRVDAIVPTTDGFIASCNDAVFYSYAAEGLTAAETTKNDERRRHSLSFRDFFRNTAVYSLSNRVSKDAVLNSVAVSPDDRHVCAIVNGECQIYSFELKGRRQCGGTTMMATTATFRSNDEQRRQQKKQQQQTVDNNDTAIIIPDAISVCQGHRGPIIGIDVCIRKPLVISGGSSLNDDRTIRIWNYLTGALELCKSFHEEIFSVAFHPSGLHCLVGFYDKLRLMNVLVDDFRSHREVAIKMCRCCQFSCGGQAFAAVQGSVVSVFDFHSGTKYFDLKGHNTKVHSLLWGVDDSVLVSCDEDGTIYQWDMITGQRVAEYTKKGSPYNYCAMPNMKKLWVVDNGGVNELSQPNLEFVDQYDCSGDDGANTRVARVVASHLESSFFIVGLSRDNKPDCIRTCAFPEQALLDITQVGTATSHWRVTHDDKYLIVTDSYGCLNVFEIEDKRRNISQSLITAVKDDGRNDLPKLDWCEDVLVNESDLEEKIVLISDLKSKLDELVTHNEYHLQMRDKLHTDQIKEIETTHINNLNNERHRNEKLRNEIENAQSHHKKQIATLKSQHQREIAALEVTHQKNLLSNVDNFQRSLREWDAEQETSENHRRALKDKHKQYSDQLLRGLETKLDDEIAARHKLQNERTQLIKKIDETTRQLEDDIDTELQHIEKRYEDLIAAERAAVLHYTGENGIVSKKTVVVLKDADDVMERAAGVRRREAALRGEIASRDDEIRKYDERIASRDDVVSLKDNTVRALRKKNRELEKFKFVLDDKIASLTFQLQPRDEDIRCAKETMRRTHEALGEYCARNEALTARREELGRDVERLQKRVVPKKRKDVNALEALHRRLLGELYDCRELIQQPRELWEKVCFMKEFIEKNGVSVASALETTTPASLSLKESDGGVASTISGHGNVSSQDKLQYQEMRTQKEQEQQQELNDTRTMDELQQSFTQMKREMNKKSMNYKKEMAQYRNENEDLLREIEMLRCQNERKRHVLRQEMAQIQQLATGGGSGSGSGVLTVAANSTGSAMRRKRRG